MKVLRIWHAAVVSEYRKKILSLTKFPDVDLTLLIPASWREGGNDVFYRYDNNIDINFNTVVGRIINKNNIRRYMFLAGLYRSLSQIRPDIIDMEEEPFAFITAQVILYCKMLGLQSKIIFHTAHNIKRPMARIFEYIQRLAFQECAAAVARNNEAAAILRQKGYRGLIFIGGNGIDLRYFSPGSSIDLKNKLGLQNRKIVGFVGKLKPGKGILTLLDAFPTLPDDTVLLLVGEGRLKEEILNIARQKRFENRLCLIGAVTHTAIPEYYRIMDVCVLPSKTEMRWKESFGRTLVEAMACGIPVIGSSSGAIPETIGNAGLIFPEGNASQLAQQINDILNNESLRNELVHAGLIRAQDFSWDAIATKNHQAYSELMKSSSNAHKYV